MSSNLCNEFQDTKYVQPERGKGAEMKQPNNPLDKRLSFQTFVMKLSPWRKANKRKVLYG